MVNVEDLHQEETEKRLEIACDVDINYLTFFNVTSKQKPPKNISNK